jgi:hypothetical protein
MAKMLENQMPVDRRKKVKLKRRWKNDVKEET